MLPMKPHNIKRHLHERKKNIITCDTNNGKKKHGVKDIDV